MSINRVVISGNLTRDPELRVTTGGTQVLSFGVAVNDRRRNPQSGDWEDYPNFVDCTMFGSRAEAISRYLSKGSKVAIEGKLRYSSWERDGQRRSKLEVIVDEIEFLSRGNGQGGQGSQGSYNQGGQGSYGQGGSYNQGGYNQGGQGSYNNQGGYSSQSGSGYSSQSQGSSSQRQSTQAPTPPEVDVYDDDIPF